MTNDFCKSRYHYEVVEINCTPMFIHLTSLELPLLDQCQRCIAGLRRFMTHTFHSLVKESNDIFKKGLSNIAFFVGGKREKGFAIYAFSQYFSLAITSLIEFANSTHTNTYKLFLNFLFFLAKLSFRHQSLKCIAYLWNIILKTLQFHFFFSTHLVVPPPIKM